MTMKGPDIELIKGDITEVDVDAVVNAANNHLWMGGGVAGAIKSKGGIEIEEEAMRQGPIEVGKAIVTNAGVLKARFVIHAAVMGQDLRTDEEKIRKATLSAILIAEEKNLNSIAFPALGCGVGGFPLDKSAKIMKEVLNQYSKNGIKRNFLRIKKVIFVLFDDKAYEIFKDEFNQQ